MIISIQKRNLNQFINLNYFIIFINFIINNKHNYLKI